MPLTLPNLGLRVWNAPTDPYNSAQLAQNFYRIDEHDHSPGKGRVLSADSLADFAVTSLKLADQSVTTLKLADVAVTTGKLANLGVTTAKLDDLGVTTGKLANLGVTTGKMADAAVTVPKLDAIVRDLTGDALQEGVVGGGDGLVTRLGGTTVRVAAGSAWIDGDGAHGLPGRYRVTWSQSDITIAAPGGVLERGYRIVVPVPGDGHGPSVPIAQAGTDQAAVDHTALQGVPALASGDLQLATVISATAISVTNDDTQGIRDRRARARGVKHRVVRTSDTLNTTTVVGFANAISLSGGAFDFRMEANGSGLVEVGLDIAATTTNVETLGYQIVLLDNGTAVHQWNVYNGQNSLHIPLIPTQGSHLFTFQHFLTSAGTAGIDVSILGTRGRTYGWTREHIGTTGNNGTV